MTDANRAPRRVSMAYILGFSNKPFKDGGPPVPAQPPPPRHPSAFKKMVSTPGGVLEWTASDGRRGRLTGPGKPRLSTVDTAPADAAKAAEQDAGDDEGGLIDLFANDTPAKAASVKATQDDDAEGSCWMKEEDEKLMELKGNNISWAEIAEKTGKKDHECRERFKQIKPKDWKPNNAKGGTQKQGKQKGQKQKDNQNNDNDSGNQDADKKGENANGGFDAAADDPWSNNTGPTAGDNNATQNDDPWGGDVLNLPANSTEDVKADDGFKQVDNGWGGGNSGNTNTDGDWRNTNGNIGGEGGGGGGWGDSNGNGDATNTWGNSGGSGDGNTNRTGDGFNSNDTPAWGNDTTNKNNASPDGNNNNVWGSTNNANSDNASKKNSSSKPPSTNSSNKPSSDAKQHSSSKTDKHPRSAPSEYELKPDSTFSADDLRLIARILQQDCQLVWNRVSWRFMDKTGRNLPPDVFEKKITGRVEHNGSERGR